MTLWQIIGLLIAGSGFGLALGLCIYANELRKRERFGPVLSGDEVTDDCRLADVLRGHNGRETNR